jgi:hypothetical protein
MHLNAAVTMRLNAVITATALFASACGSTSFRIPPAELARLATLPPEVRGDHVRVVEQLEATDSVGVNEVSSGTPVQPRQRGTSEGLHHSYFSHPGSSIGHAAVRPGGGGGHFGGGGGDGRAYAIAILVAAAIILVATAEIEGARYDVFARVNPMQQVQLFSKDGDYAVVPLAWIDPQTAAETDTAIINSTDGPWQPLGRAPLDRAGWTYAMLGGVGTFKSIDGTRANGAASTIQLGYFPTQQLGVLASTYFGGRHDSYGDFLFESRYTLELDDYVAHAGPVHLGFYAGGGGAYRWEDSPTARGAGDAGSTALLGGTQLQLDVNTRLALTARFGETYAHGEPMTDALFGLALY